MSYADFLRDTVTVRRLNANVLDAYGKPYRYDDFKAARGHIEGLSGDLKFMEGQGEAGFGQYRLFLLLTYNDGTAIDVTEHDRVSIGGQEYLVMFPDAMDGARGPHHIELILRKVS